MCYPMPSASQSSSVASKAVVLTYFSTGVVNDAFLLAPTVGHRPAAE
jgi:hypothetical protein